MTKNTTQAGNQAEQAVAEELSRQGYEIIELNWKTPYAEIDIVASKQKTIYFVEVKYRGSKSAGDGFDYITLKKLQHMQRAAEAWVLTNSWNGPYELLGAAVLPLNNDYEIEIIEI